MFPDTVELRESAINGLGVFAKDKIRKNTKIGFYDGTKYTLREFKEKYGKDTRYCYVVRRYNYVICAKETRNFGTWINESKTPNVKFSKQYIVASRDIEKDEELTLMYPSSYPREYKLE